MGLQQSKDALLYQQASCGNVDAVRALRGAGAGLEYVDREGKTPLIAACMKPDGFSTVKALIDLGANVNAYRPGHHAGTPLHHAAKKGLEQIVHFLLTHGANVLRINDDCQTALDLAREKGHANVVRTIENHLCSFSGWLRELHGPGFLEAFALQWVSRKIWAVILPSDHRSIKGFPRLVLAIYPDSQVAQPRDIISLWNVKLEELNFNQPDPVVVIIDMSTKKRYRFLSAREGDKQQILCFYNACKGVPQEGLHTETFDQVDESSLSSQATASAPTSALEVEQLGMAIRASLQSAIAEGIRHFSDIQPPSQDSSTSGWGNSDSSTYNGWGAPDRPSLPADITNGWSDEAADDGYNGWAFQGTWQSTPSQSHNGHNSEPTIISPATGVSAVTSIPSNDKFNGWASTESVPNAPSQSRQNHSNAAVTNTPAYGASPSAPPLVDDTYVGGTIRYPSIDLSPVDYPSPEIEVKPGATAQEEKANTSGLCIICLDAAAEGACIPCGHMAGCMSCLNEIKAKKWGCPVCRAKIDQVVKLYSV